MLEIDDNFRKDFISRILELSRKVSLIITVAGINEREYLLPKEIIDICDYKIIHRIGAEVTYYLTGYRKDELNASELKRGQCYIVHNGKPIYKEEPLEIGNKEEMREFFDKITNRIRQS